MMLILCAPVPDQIDHQTEDSYHVHSDGASPAHLMEKCTQFEAVNEKDNIGNPTLLTHPISRRSLTRGVSGSGEAELGVIELCRRVVNRRPKIDTDCCSGF